MLYKQLNGDVIRIKRMEFDSIEEYQEFFSNNLRYREMDRLTFDHATQRFETHCATSDILEKDIDYLVKTKEQMIRHARLMQRAFKWKFLPDIEQQLEGVIPDPNNSVQFHYKRPQDVFTRTLEVFIIDK